MGWSALLASALLVPAAPTSAPAAAAVLPSFKNPIAGPPGRIGWRMAATVAFPLATPAAQSAPLQAPGGLRPLPARLPRQQLREASGREAAPWVGEGRRLLGAVDNAR